MRNVRRRNSTTPQRGRELTPNSHSREISRLLQNGETNFTVAPDDDGSGSIFIDDDVSIHRLFVGMFNSSRKNEVEYINLNGLSIETLPAGIFDELPNLEEVSINNNKNLTTLPPGLFDKNPKLLQVDFSDTKLTSLPANLFKNNIRLQSLLFKNVDTIPGQDYLRSGIRNLRNLELLVINRSVGEPPESSPHQLIRALPNYNNFEFKLDDDSEDEEYSSVSSGFSDDDEELIAEVRRQGVEEDEEELADLREAQEDGGKPPFDVECLNDEDPYLIEDFTKGKQEYRELNRVIILNEGKGHSGLCYPRTFLMRSLITPLETNGEYTTNANETKRYFKMPSGVWVDQKGVQNLFSGWKVLRLKYIEERKIGFSNVKQKIYTLVKVNSKYQERDPLRFENIFNSNLDVILTIKNPIDFLGQF